MAPGLHSGPTALSNSLILRALAGVEQTDEKPSRWSRFSRGLLRFLLLMLAAFLGGIVATVAYHMAVERPRQGEPRRPPVRATSIAPPPTAGEQHQVIDPLYQALAVARTTLPSGALLKFKIKLDRGVVHLTGQTDSRQTLSHAARALGKVPGVKAVDTRGVRLAWRAHVIVKGDTPIKISRGYYGDSCGWSLIVAANPQLDPRVLRIGKTLVIPPDGS